MDNSANRPNFEEQWRKAFEEAETPPAPRVWKNIEGQLAAQQSGRYRKGFLWYRAIAAAFLLCIAGLSWYILSQHNTSDVTQVEQPPAPATDDGRITNDTPPHEDSSADIASGPGKSSSSEAIAPTKQQTAGSPSVLGESPGQSVSSEAQKSVKASSFQGADQLVHTDESRTLQKQNDDMATGGYDENAANSLSSPVHAQTVAHRSSSLLALVTPNGVDTDIALSEVAQIDQLYRVPEVPADTKKERQPLRFFAGLTITPNYFDPQFEAAAPAGPPAPPAPSRSPGSFVPLSNGVTEASNDNFRALAVPAEGTDHQQELSFSYGLDVGMALSEHWVIESGVDYNRFNTTTHTRYEGTNVRTGERFPLTAYNSYNLDESDVDANPTAQTDVNNTYQFVSIPVKVGYSFNVKRLSFVLSSGVAANFFVKNAIASSSERFTTANVYAEDAASPFNRQYLSGLVSGGVNYNIISRYHVSFTPTYAFALSDLTREDSNLSSQPYSWGVNVGFQYTF